MEISLRTLNEEISRCDICRKHLPLGPRPVVQFSSNKDPTGVGAREHVL